MMVLRYFIQSPYYNQVEIAFPSTAYNSVYFLLPMCQHLLVGRLIVIMLNMSISFRGQTGESIDHNRGGAIFFKGMTLNAYLGRMQVGRDA
jgi:hypothetical protein